MTLAYNASALNTNQLKLSYTPRISRIRHFIISYETTPPTDCRKTLLVCQAFGEVRNLHKCSGPHTNKICLLYCIRHLVLFI